MVAWRDCGNNFYLRSDGAVTVGASPSSKSSGPDSADFDKKSKRQIVSELKNIQAEGTDVRLTDSARFKDLWKSKRRNRWDNSGFRLSCKKRVLKGLEGEYFVEVWV